LINFEAYAKLTVHLTDIWTPFLP